MHVNLDPQLVDKIANEVKSQGVFDQFRKDSMADVDTKPAYQNLRQRVENTVNKFLSEQKWTPDLNKNQLRERLRKHITEAGFLDVGVERIVDQVVNPKIATVFQPKIEDIAYKYIGIPKPQVKINTSEVPTSNGMLTIETDLMPTDLEQVSPDSDKDKSDSKDDIELDDKMDDFESPPFEPIEIKPNDHQIDINGDEKKEEVVRMIETTDTPTDGSGVVEDEVNIENNHEKVKMDASTPVKMEDEREIIVSGEASQESQLSQVSSDSRLSIVTNDNTQEEDTTACQIKEENEVNISEEAQMPKFNENSNSSSEKKSSVPLHFDIKKDEIKFEGTERKLEPPTEELSPNTSDEIRLDNSLESKIVDNSQNNDIPLPSHEYSFEKEKEFNFSRIDVKVELEEVTKTASLDDSADRELQIIEKSEISQCSISQQSPKSPTSRQDKIAKPSSATSSPSQNKTSSREKDHSSSSRHKKHSKDRRSERDRYSSSSHKASSSTSLKSHSSKSSSSHKVSSTSSDYHHHRSSSSSVHKSRHISKNGKSSRGHHDSKDSHSRDHSKSKYEKSKEKSSKDKSERSKTADDHYSSKQKWRKSSDSNDEGDSSRDDQSTSLPKDSSSSRDNATNGTLNSSTTSSGNPPANNPSDTGDNADTPCSTNVISQNIVILDNLLGNPDTNFIEIGNACFQVNTSASQAPICSYDGDFLYYFESNNQSKNDFDSRIKILTNNMEDIRNLLQTSLNFPRKLSTTESDGNTSLEMEKNRDSSSPRGCAMKRHFESPNAPPSLTSATLTIDCIQYGGNTSTSNCLNKRYKFNGNSVTKVSPTPSELSVNSKENEFVDKNALSDSESSIYPSNTKRDTSKTISEKRNKVVNRNQRYSSEDLYKPRPILSQRSRRRGLDAII